MPRRKKDIAPDVAKLAILLIFLMSLWLANGDIKKIPGILWGIVILLFVAAATVGILALVVYLFRRKADDGLTFLPVEIEPVSRTAPSSPDLPQSPNQPLLNHFTLSLVRSLEWRRFEILVEGLFARQGYVASRIRAGADGGVDLVLRREPDGPIEGIVQCKSWTSLVGVKPVRELFGVMAAEGVALGHFVCCGGYTREATEWAKNKPLSLISGDELVVRLNSLPVDTRDSLLAGVTSGNYTTPTCPSCDIKMVRRSGKNGEFWGCRNYPRCRNTLNGR